MHLVTRDPLKKQYNLEQLKHILLMQTALGCGVCSYNKDVDSFLRASYITKLGILMSFPSNGKFFRQRKIREHELLVFTFFEDCVQRGNSFSQINYYDIKKRVLEISDEVWLRDTISELEIVVQRQHNGNTLIDLRRSANRQQQFNNSISNQIQ
jgi:hypothetical protein